MMKSKKTSSASHESSLINMDHKKTHFSDFWRRLKRIYVFLFKNLLLFMLNEINYENIYLTKDTQTYVDI